MVSISFSVLVPFLEDGFSIARLFASCVKAARKLCESRIFSKGFHKKDGRFALDKRAGAMYNEIEPRSKK